MDLTKWDLSSLRYITNTAAALPTGHILKLRKLVPHAKIYSMYGLTECKRVSYLPPDQIDIRPTSVGRGMPNEEVYIVDAQGNKVGPGVTGELVIRGSNVMKGYWEDPEATDKVLKPGPFPGERVLHSGDLFSADEEGYLYFVGRKDDIIKVVAKKSHLKKWKKCCIPSRASRWPPWWAFPMRLSASNHGRDCAPAGARLTAAKVLRHCSAHLEDFMVPNGRGVS